MRKRLYKAFPVLVATLIMLCVAACGKQPAETSTEVEEGTEGTEEESTEKDKFDPKNHVYETYPTFITEFKLEDGVLTVKTEDVGLEDYPIPEDMEFSFSYPLADGFTWDDKTAVMGDNNADADAMYEWFSFYLESAKFDLDAYKDGNYSDMTGEEFCEQDVMWHITVEDGKVTEFLCDDDSVADNANEKETNLYQQQNGHLRNEC